MDNIKSLEKSLFVSLSKYRNDKLHNLSQDNVTGILSSNIDYVKIEQENSRITAEALITIHSLSNANVDITLNDDIIKHIENPSTQHALEKADGHVLVNGAVYTSIAIPLQFELSNDNSEFLLSDVEKPSIDSDLNFEISSVAINDTADDYLSTHSSLIQENIMQEVSDALQTFIEDVPVPQSLPNDETLLVTMSDSDYGNLNTLLRNVRQTQSSIRDDINKIAKFAERQPIDSFDDTDSDDEGILYRRVVNACDLSITNTLHATDEVESLIDDVESESFSKLFYQTLADDTSQIINIGNLSWNNILDYSENFPHADKDERSEMHMYLCNTMIDNLQRIDDLYSIIYSTIHQAIE